MKNIAVKDQPGLVRNGDGGYIKNVDKEAFLDYIKRRDEIKKSKDDVVNLKQQVEELTLLVQQLIKDKQ